MQVLEDKIYDLLNIYDFEKVREDDVLILYKLYERTIIGDDYEDYDLPSIHWKKSSNIEISYDGEYSISAYDTYETIMLFERVLALLTPDFNTNIQEWTTYDYQRYHDMDFNDFNISDINTIKGRRFNISKKSDKYFISLPVDEDVTIETYDIKSMPIFSPELHLVICIRFFTNEKNGTFTRSNDAFGFIKNYITNEEGSSFKYDIASMFER